MTDELRGDVHPYGTLAYARALAHAGRPLAVPPWHTHVIVRDWHGSAGDATGPYPITCFAAGCDLRAGLALLQGMGLVSMTAVVDELAGPPIGAFADAFSLVRPYKTHYLVDATAGAYQPSEHHRRELRRAGRLGVEVRGVALSEIVADWTALYGDLIARHRITGVQRFSRASFDALAGCDGLATYAAYIGDELVSCHLWMRHGSVVRSHLAASSARGYATGAAYAVNDHAIRCFAGALVNLGGAAGTAESADDGLSRFKAGFANRTSTSYLIGSILDAGEYRRLAAKVREPHDGAWFPLYRAPAQTSE